MMSGISWYKFRVPTGGTLVQVDKGHFQDNFGPYPAILVENIIFCPILMYEIDFYVQEESKNTIGNNNKSLVKGGYPRKKLVKIGPNFHHFWNCGHIMPKHKTKIYMDHTSVMIDMCVKFEKTPKTV